MSEEKSELTSEPIGQLEAGDEIAETQEPEVVAHSADDEDPTVCVGVYVYN